jgi:hypothetical protein
MGAVKCPETVLVRKSESKRAFGRVIIQWIVE